MEETISKMMHSQRQESQQQRREEKVRQEKERLMTETDPDKLRKLEVCYCYITAHATSHFTVIVIKLIRADNHWFFGNSQNLIKSPFCSFNVENEAKGRNKRWTTEMDSQKFS